MNTPHPDRTPLAAPEEEGLYDPTDSFVPLTDEDIAGASRSSDLSDVADSADIPTDPKERLSRVPCPKKQDGTPCFTLHDLDPAHRAALKAAHAEKIRKTLEETGSILARCAKDGAFRGEVIELCRRDPVFFISHFCWVVDPRSEDPNPELFVPYAEQEESIRWWWEVFLPRARSPKGIRVGEEKSRAIGATWEKVLELLHAWLFVEGFSALVALDIEDDIDDGGMESTPDTWFGKFRFALEHLPDWLVPGDVRTNPTANKIRSIRNPANGNYLKGRQYCANLGRSRRYTVVICDELSVSQKGNVALTGLSQTTRGIYCIWTPIGLANAAGKMRFDETQKIIRTRHWTLNPNLDVEWYWNEVAKYGVTLCASELDIDYERSTGNAILLRFSPETHVVTDLDYDKNLPLTVLMDPGFGDPFAIVWAQYDRYHNEWRLIDHVQFERVPAEFLVPFLIGHVPAVTSRGKPWPYTYRRSELDIIERHGVWGAPDDAYGDAAGRAASSLSGQFSVYHLFESYGMTVIDEVKIGPNEKIMAVDRVIQALPRIRIAGRLMHQRTQSKTSPTLVECFQHWAWYVPPTESQLPYRRQPRHDRYCHAMDCVQFLLKDQDVTVPEAQPIPPASLARRLGGRVGSHAVLEDEGDGDTYDELTEA